MPVSCLSLTWDCSVELLIFFWAAVMGIQTALDETILPLIRIISYGKILHFLVPKVELIRTLIGGHKRVFCPWVPEE